MGDVAARVNWETLISVQMTLIAVVGCVKIFDDVVILSLTVVGNSASWMMTLGHFGLYFLVLGGLVAVIVRDGSKVLRLLDSKIPMRYRRCILDESLSASSSLKTHHFCYTRDVCQSIAEIHKLRVTQI